MRRRRDSQGHRRGHVSGGFLPFVSWKLPSSQQDWSPREKEAYALVLDLCKWDSWIGLQLITVHSDHHSLQHWHSEAVDTPSGPSGRKGRWHQLLLKFNLTVLYIPGKDSIVADAMSRWAYPASKSFRDVSMHGGALSKIDMEREIQLERERERCSAPLVPCGSHLACQALSFAESTGGLITHLEETLDRLPIPEGEKADPLLGLARASRHAGNTAGDSAGPRGAGFPTLTRDTATPGTSRYGRHRQNGVRTCVPTIPTAHHGLGLVGGLCRRCQYRHRMVGLPQG